VIYGELPMWQDNGRMVYGWAGNEALRASHAGSNAHVHFSSFDKGGWLMPGLTLAHNGTGSPERVGGGATVVNVTVHGWVGNERSLARQIRDALNELDRANTGGRVLRSTPPLT
jgi:hypothetical protein